MTTGTTWSADGSFTDPGDDSRLATVDVGEGPTPLELTGRAFTLTTTFTEAGDHDVVVEVCDDDEGGCTTEKTTVTVTPPANDAPDARIDAPASVREGSPVTLDGSSSTDADGHVVSYAWDLDGDGQYDDATGPTAGFTPRQDGTLVVGLEVVDDGGLAATDSVTVQVTNVVPEVTLPASSTVVAGKPWSLSGSFADPGDDTFSATADLADGAGWTPLDLTGQDFTLTATFATTGTKQVKVEVCDGKECSPVSTTVTVTPAPTPPPSTTWPWDGFYAPVDNLPVVNMVKAGSTVPLKFSLGGYRGMAVFAAGYPASAAHSCSSTSPTDQLESTATPGESELTYDPGTGRYQYNWKTQKSWAGQCRTLLVKLADGTVHTAEFRLK